MGTLRSAASSLLLASALLVAAAARADGGNAAIAEGLFTDAKRLLDQGKPDLACPKFAESLRLDPTLGTRLNLAHCHEVQGKTATAWGEYKEVIRLGAGDAKRVAIAKDRVAALEPNLAHATITGTAEPGLKLKLDGNVLDAAILGTSFPIDPGDHAVELSAPGKQTRTVDFHVEPTKSTGVELPALEAVRAVAPEPEKAAQPKPEAPPQEQVSQGKRIGGWVAIGGGVAALGVGVAFGIMTLSLASDVKAACPTGPCPTQADLDKNSAAHTYAILSDVFIPVGLV
ncbi:MAG TPA: hypothetical protein VLM85_18010, partial [Polyangiaceae bacterium]|nr:hypothetical protein [Polyangiaceae bacterium]